MPLSLGRNALPHTAASVARPARRKRLGPRSLAVLAAMLALAIFAFSMLAGPGGGETVAYRVWNSNSAADENPAVVFASSPGEWEQMWVRTGRAAPPFDDRRTIGVGIFLGERDGRRHIQVVGAAQRGQRIVVTYEEVLDATPLAPRAAAAPEAQKSTAAPTPASDDRSAPWAIIRVERVDLPISIEQRVRD